MATDWAADVKKYDAKADDTAIAGIVRYCGIALRNRDSALVSFSDKAETDRVRTNFLKKKLGLTQSDAVLDAAIAKVGDQMKADRTKNRVTVYYLLASEFKALGQFVKAAPAAKKAPAAIAAAPAAKPAPAKVAADKPVTTKTPTPKTAAKPAAAKAAATAKPVKAAPAAKAPAAKAVAAPAKKVAAPAKATTAKAAAPAANATQGLLDKAATAASDAGKAAPKVAAAAVAGTAAAIGAASMAKDTPAKPAQTASTPPPVTAKPLVAAAPAADDGSEMNWLWWVIGIAVLGFLAWWLFLRGPDTDDANTAEAAASAAASDVGTDLAAAPAEGSITIPAGAGVTSELRDNKPVVKVYFDSGMTAVTPEFAKTAGGLKSWIDTHAGATLAVSGYSDPSGNAKVNADLAKQRAQAVQSALVAAGIPATSAALVKPDEAIDPNVAKDAARRVEVTVK